MDYDLYYPSSLSDYYDDSNDVEKSEPTNKDDNKILPDNENYDLIIKCNFQNHNCTEIKEFVEKYPNSFLVFPVKDATLLRLDTRRKKNYGIMLVPSLKDTMSSLYNNDK